MTSSISKHIIHFLLLTLLQIGILKYLVISPYFSLLIYPLFLLLLPIKTPRALLITIGFVAGLCIDFFENSGGCHAIALTTLAFVRPVILNYLISKEDVEVDALPNIRLLGWQQFALYAVSAIFIHHLIFFLFNVMRFEFFGYFVLKTFGSVLVSTLFILSLMLFFNPKGKRR